MYVKKSKGGGRFYFYKAGLANNPKQILEGCGSVCANFTLQRHLNIKTSMRKIIEILYLINFYTY